MSIEYKVTQRAVTDWYQVCGSRLSAGSSSWPSGCTASQRRNSGISRRTRSDERWTHTVCILPSRAKAFLFISIMPFPCCLSIQLLCVLALSASRVTLHRGCPYISLITLKKNLRHRSMVQPSSPARAAPTSAAIVTQTGFTTQAAPLSSSAHTPSPAPHRHTSKHTPTPRPPSPPQHPPTAASPVPQPGSRP